MRLGRGADPSSGENFQNIGRQLLHAWGTTTYEAYIGAYM